MAKAMGCNTIAAYIFWNYHEPEEGTFDFATGNHDLARFIKTAQQEGLWVLLRPGPVRLRGMGFRRYSVVPPEGPRASRAQPVPALHAGGRTLHGPVGARDPAAARHPWRADRDGAGRERVRQLRERSELHDAAPRRLEDARHRRAVLHGRRPHALHARGRQPAGRGRGPRFGIERTALGPGAIGRARGPDLLVRNLSGLADALGRTVGRARAPGTHPGSHVPPREQEVLQLLRRARRHEFRIHRRGEFGRQGRLRTRRHQLRLRRAHQRTGSRDAKIPGAPRPDRVVSPGRTDPPARARSDSGHRHSRVPDGAVRVALGPSAGADRVRASPAVRELRTEPGSRAVPDDAGRSEERAADHHGSARLRARLRGRHVHRHRSTGDWGRRRSTCR